MRHIIRLAICLGLIATGSAWGHAPPEIPVRTDFQEDGSVVIRIEVDPRSFTPDPDQVQYTFLKDFLLMDDDQRSRLTESAKEYTADAVAYFFAPTGEVVPEFEFGFTTYNNLPLTQAYDHVVLTGVWKTRVPRGAEAYRISANENNTLEVYFLNYVNGQPLKRFQVLFPGEDSFDLKIGELASMASGGEELGSSARARNLWNVVRSFIRMGFVHVIPKGWDHILFVLGVFLLSRKWRPLLLQVSTFTLAHSITLALAALGIVQIPGEIVEPIIAASIVFVAAENIFRSRYTHWRLVLVFGFGLIHGLGFAGVLGNLQLIPASLLTSLIGFNVGVEFGQLAVIALAAVLVFWINPDRVYRRWVVVPGSLLIALFGIWWFAERTFLS